MTSRPIEERVAALEAIRAAEAVKLDRVLDLLERIRQEAATRDTERARADERTASTLDRLAAADAEARARLERLESDAVRRAAELHARVDATDERQAVTAAELARLAERQHGPIWRDSDGRRMVYAGMAALVACSVAAAGVLSSATVDLATRAAVAWSLGLPPSAVGIRPDVPAPSPPTHPAHTPRPAPPEPDHPAPGE